MFRSLWWRLSSLVRRQQLTRELDEEVHSHHEELQQAFEGEGHNPREAARLSRLRLGGNVQIREASEDEWRLSMLEGFGQDLAHAFRSLRHRPGFTVAAVVTLATGIGVSTAIFSVAYGVSIRPLPYPNPARLIRIYESNTASSQPRNDVSERAFQAWREGAPAIEIAAFLEKPSARTLERPLRQRLTVRSVTPTFFVVLGVHPFLGPGFKREEEYTRFNARDAVLSYDAWQRLFNGRPDVVDTPIAWANDENEFRVVGVLPEGFTFGDAVDVWVPDRITVPMGVNFGHDRDGQVIARMREPASLDRTRDEVERVADRLAAEAPSVHGGWTVTVEPLQQSIVGNFARWTWLLFAAVVIVQLVACLNVGALLLARAVTRERETAMRVALGGTTSRLVRLWLAEALVIGGVGAGLGLLFAELGVSVLKAAAPPGIPRLEAVALDAPVLALAMFSLLLAVTGFTLAPLRLRAHRSLTPGLRAGSSGAGDDRARQAVRSTLMATQCAGAATLAVIAVMLTRSLLNLMSVDLGWDARNVVSLQVDPSVPSGLDRPWYARVQWSDTLVSQLEAMPGVARAAIATHLPLSAAPYGASLARGKGGTSTDERRWPAVAHKVTDGYFELMGIRLLAGRTFGVADRFTEAEINGRAAPPRLNKAAIVTAETARTLWPGASPIGQPLWLPPRRDWFEVVGVVEDIQFFSVGENPALHVFVPWTQDSAWARPYLMVKAEALAPFLVPTVRDVIRRATPGTEINEVIPLDDVVARATAQPRFSSRLVLAFGSLALALAAVGIYGTLSYLVSARTREIGIRLALGASHGSVLWNVIRRGLVPVIGGGAVGVAVAFALARVFRSLFFEVGPMDPTSLGAGALVLFAVALVAAVGPAFRAARVDPVRALRVE